MAVDEATLGAASRAWRGRIPPTAAGLPGGIGAHRENREIVDHPEAGPITWSATS